MTAALLTQQKPIPQQGRGRRSPRSAVLLQGERAPLPCFHQILNRMRAGSATRKRAQLSAGKAFPSRAPSKRDLGVPWELVKNADLLGRGGRRTRAPVLGRPLAGGSRTSGGPHGAVGTRRGLGAAAAAGLELATGQTHQTDPRPWLGRDCPGNRGARLAGIPAPPCGQI